MTHAFRVYHIGDSPLIAGLFSGLPHVQVPGLRPFLFLGEPPCLNARHICCDSSHGGGCADDGI